MLESCMRPDLVTEITLQPVRRHKVDAAIYFSDIVVPLKAIGIDLDIKPGVGPVVAEPDPHPRRPGPAARPRRPSDVSYVTEAIGMLTAELGATPLIGFAGAPFTLASYLVEGGPSRNHERTKAMMYGDPRAVGRPARPARRDHRRLPEGADRGGRLAPSSSSTPGSARWPPPTTAAHVMPASAKVFDAVAVVRRAAHPLRRRHRRTARPDGRGGRGRRRRRLAGPAGRGRPPGRPRQGAPGQPRPGGALRADARPSRPRPARCWTPPRGLEGHIFNLGHGVLPDHRPGRADPRSSSTSTRRPRADARADGGRRCRRRSARLPYRPPPPCAPPPGPGPTPGRTAGRSPRSSAVICSTVIPAVSATAAMSTRFAAPSRPTICTPEQPPRAALREHLHRHRRRARVVAGAARRLDGRGDEAQPDRRASLLPQPRPGDLQVADLADRGADHAGEGARSRRRCWCR